MALILKTNISKSYGTLPVRSSKFYIRALSSYLSEPYELLDGDEIKGEIISVKNGTVEFPDLRGKEITLIIKTGLLFDDLFISKTDWKRFFREKGLVLPPYSIELRLTEAMPKLTKKPVKLYTERDVTWQW